VSFDTDLVGRHGYSVDLSRSWVTGELSPTDEQRRLYGLAHAQIQHNLGVIRPGRTFREIADAAYKLPERFVPRMNRAIAHGIGLCNEYPLIVNREYFAGAYDGVVEEGMVLCVESYVGEPGGGVGVKLEEQTLITNAGAVVLSSFPFEEQLL
jgi:Xaa-Pro aminopeptidase